jgi:SAM-dependent methyltransferase
MFYGDRLEALMSALGAEQPAGRSLLDVGCGPGNFLEAALRAGWRVQGVEPSHRAAQHAQSKGLRIHNRMFDAELARILAPFDAIHCMNVLEHVPDPIGLLSAIHKCIRPGGALCVGVPNDYNAFQRALRQAGKRPWWVVPPHHLNYFTFESLEALLRRCGFVPASRLTSYPMETFLLMGRDYVGDDRAGQEMHAERKAFDSALNALDPVIRRKFYQSLAAAGFGREAIVVAVRS